MIDHVATRVRDLAATRGFYDQVLAGLGASVHDLDGHNAEDPLA